MPEIVRRTTLSVPLFLSADATTGVPHPEPEQDTLKPVIPEDGSSGVLRLISSVMSMALVSMMADVPLKVSNTPWSGNPFA
jgi:hypothetical protein